MTGFRGSDPFVEQVRAATDIVALVSSYLELRQAGRRWKGVCPFHTEKTPSFFVHEENQTFYCFGCHQGGDVFRFLMLQERLTFPEALRMLAEKAGIPMPRLRGHDSSEDRIGEALEVAAAFYRNMLRSPAGGPALAYLAKRGIDEKEIERYGIGWAPASWDGLLRHARQLLPERALIQAGLLIEGERGLYDRFRERIMIPVRTAGGRTVAFGGRLLGPGEPKYLNSPETSVYRKGTILFGLPEAREAIRSAGNLIVVEGYFDVIALMAAGIGNAVGTCGTALSADQAALLRRYGERWTLLFDGDFAGRAAVLRALDAAVPVHPGVRIALCPDGLDPDTWVRGDGADAVRAGVARAVTPLQYLDTWTRDQGMQIEQIIPRAAELLKKVADPLVRERWVQEAAGRFHLTEARIWSVIGKSTGTEAGRSAAMAAAGFVGGRDASSAGENAGADRAGAVLTARERQIVSAAVRRPVIAPLLIAAIDGLPVVGTACREILDWISSIGDGVDDAAGLLSRAAEDPGRMRDFAFMHGEAEDPDPGVENPEEILRRLQLWGLRYRMRSLTDSIRLTEEQGGDVAPLLAQQQEMAEAMRQLGNSEGSG
jgi:DNA primase